MTKVLFVLGGYLNQTSQNGICVEDISREMIKANVDVHYLCIEESHKSIVDIPSNTSIVYRKRTNSTVNKTKHLIKKLFTIPLDDLFVAKQLFVNIKRLDTIHTFDAIISVINPTESAYAVSKYKTVRNSFKFILYEIDPSSNRYKVRKNVLELMWTKLATRWEKKIYRRADKIIHMISHKVHFSNKRYQEFIGKTVYLDIPSMNAKDNDSEFIKPVKSDSDTLFFIYSGNFYPALRNPDYMIKTMSELSDKLRLHFEIYTGGNMINHVKKLVNLLKKSFLVNNMIPREKLNQFICNSDYLVSVGNKDSDFLPSKIFYYIGILKPIIHFYSSKEDVAIPYLKKYPLALLIDQTAPISSNVDIIIKFITNPPNVENMSFPINDIFFENTPKHTATEIMRLIND